MRQRIIPNICKQNIFQFKQQISIVIAFCHGFCFSQIDVQLIHWNGNENSRSFAKPNRLHGYNDFLWISFTYLELSWIFDCWSSNEKKVITASRCICISWRWKRQNETIKNSRSVVLLNERDKTKTKSTIHTTNVAACRSCKTAGKTQNVSCMNCAISLFCFVCTWFETKSTP